MKKEKMPLVAIAMGSDSDLPLVAETIKVLKDFGVCHKVTVASAHRSPKATRNFVRAVEKQGTEVIIAVAGGAAHLAGVIAAETILPVIALPVRTEVAGGLDSLLSMVQMPAGVPVGTMAVGKGGAVNAGVFAVQILSNKYRNLKSLLKEYKKNLASKTVRRGIELEKLGYEEYLKKKFKKN